MLPVFQNSQEAHIPNRWMRFLSDQSYSNQKYIVWIVWQNCLQIALFSNFFLKKKGDEWKNYIRNKNKISNFKTSLQQNKLN